LRPVRHRHPVRRDEVQEPQEGERLSSESFEALRDRHSEGPVPGSVLASRPTKPAGGSLRLVRRRRGGRVPLEGKQSPREARVRPLLREAGDNGLSRRAMPGRRARICTARVGRSVRANAMRAGWTERPTRAAKGESFEGQIPGALPSETRREVSGGTRRQEGRNPEDAA
jgi:hypothetical protein